jgi:hypothetical protein
MRSKLFIFTSLFIGLFFSKNIYAQQITTIIRGQIVEKATKLPIPSARVTVFLKAGNIETVSDTFGVFRLSNIPIGRQTVRVSSVGFMEQTYSNLVLNVSKDFILNIELEEGLTQLQEVVVKAQADKSQPLNTLAGVSARQFTVEETQRYAGSFLDVARMASNFAGVSAPNAGNNDIVVRGNAPLGVLWRLEGVDIPSPSHLAFVGTEGGYSIINFNNLANSDFITGAFPAEYGNRNAAVFDLKMRKGNPERYEFLGQVGIAGLEFGAEGPLSKKKENSLETRPNSSFLVSFRRFSLENLKKLGLDLGISGTPDFKDIAFKMHFPTKNNGSVTLFGLGGLSSFTENTATNISVQNSNMGVTGLTYNHYFSKILRGVFLLAYSGNATTVDRNQPDNAGQFRRIDDMTIAQNQIQTKYELIHKPTAKNLFKYGVSATYVNFNLFRKRLINNVYQNLFDDTGAAFLYQTYAHWQHRFTEKWTLNTGIYAQLFDFNNTKSLEPRLSTQYRLHPKHRLSAAVGWHSQTQPMVTYTRQFYYTNRPQPLQTNRDLDMSRSKHYVVAHDWSLNSNLRLKTELYRQDLNKIPIRKGNALYSAINSGAVENSIMNIPDSLTNEGVGYNQGVELTFERFFSNNYYYMSTLSLYESKYKVPNGIWRNTAFGHGYVWNFLGGYEFLFGKNKRNALTFDVKLNFIGGKPYIPVDLPNSIKRNTYVADVANAYLVRLPAFNRLDMKVAWRLNRTRLAHFIYLEFNNIFNSKGYLETFYNSSTKKEVFENYQLGFLPLGGYRIEWGKRRG